MQEIHNKIDDDRLQALLDYWRKKKGKGLPARSDIDPIEIPKLLRYLILADYDAALQDVRFRLVGTEMVDHWGRDFRNMHLNEIMSGEYHDYIHGLFVQTATSAQPLFSESVFRWDKGRAMRTKRLMLPLASDGRTVDAVLVGQIFIGTKAEVLPLPRMAGDGVVSVTETERHQFMPEP